MYVYRSPADDALEIKYAWTRSVSVEARQIVGGAFVMVPVPINPDVFYIHPEVYEAMRSAGLF